MIPALAGAARNLKSAVGNREVPRIKCLKCLKFKVPKVKEFRDS